MGTRCSDQLDPYRVDSISLQDRYYPEFGTEISATAHLNLDRATHDHVLLVKLFTFRHY